MYDNFVSRAEFPVDFNPSQKWINEKRLIIKMLRHMPGSVLDVGCRTGDFLMHFDTGVIREGVELSKNFAGVASKRGLKIYNDFLEKTEFTKSYEVVTCYAILEHLENPRTFLDSLTSIVNDNGILVIMIPSFQSLKLKLLSFFRIHWHMYSPPEHLNFYSRKFLNDYLNGKGFQRIGRRYSSGGMLIFKKGIFRKIEKHITKILDYSIFSKLPIFDHMYCYYRKLS
jgi:ubiquinone/menaquinone biosynthesis C-methylase UbiE